MPLKKSELYASLWKSCDELRGGMDASQYKDYVLVLLFMKYVSDKAASRPDYDLIVPPGGSFADMVALKNKADIGEGINKVIATLAEANENLRGAIDVADFNDPDKLGKGKDKVDRLTNLVGIFENPSLDFRGNSAEGDDLLGDAYEYLMRNFATESGKSKGQFYTPAEVSRIMAAVVGVTKATSGTQSIYDPTCGSGSLLLKAHDAAKSATGFDLAIYGQEMDNATAALARMNMVLHDATTAEIWQDNTLASPYFRDAAGGLKTFDYVVANPPFSTKSWSSGFDPARDLFDRFRYGMPPTKNGDYAFLLHILASLKSNGRAAVVLPLGVLFRGNAEATIRRELIRRGVIRAVVGLPANLFYGTGIPACILLLDKDGAADRRGIFMIDASRGFAKDGNKNRLRERDIHRIVDTFGRTTEIDRYSRFVPLAEIEANGFGLNIARYVDSGDFEDVHDIEGHLLGGIPRADVDALSAYWLVFPGIRDALFEAAGRDGYLRVIAASSQVGPTINAHPEFQSFNSRISQVFEEWRTENRPELVGFACGHHPKALIGSLSESLLTAFSEAPLVDSYAIYQALMEYWADTLQDDAYLISELGWSDAARPRQVSDPKDQKTRTEPDFLIGGQKFKSDLVPAALLVARFFRTEAAALDDERAAVAVLEQQISEMTEEHGVEGGLLEEVVGDNGKISKQAVTARMKELRDDPDGIDEMQQLKLFDGLLVEHASAKQTLKKAIDHLNGLVAARYAALDEAAIKALVVDDKWLARIQDIVDREMHAVSRSMTGRVVELRTRYEVSLSALTRETVMLTSRVTDHLKVMGHSDAIDG